MYHTLLNLNAYCAHTLHIYCKDTRPCCIAYRVNVCSVTICTSHVSILLHQTKAFMKPDAIQCIAIICNQPQPGYGQHSVNTRCSTLGTFVATI